MGACNCFGQTSREIKNSAGTCFCARGPSSARYLKKGEVYEACSLLTQDPEDKFAPYEPWTSADQCIVGVVGDCEIDATNWEEDCEVHVWKKAELNMTCINVPCDEKGAPLITPDDLKKARQGLDCCIEFYNQQPLMKKPQWLANQGATAKK